MVLIILKLLIFVVVICYVIIQNDFFQYFEEFNNYKILYDNQTINDYFLLSKFHDMLPRLTNLFNDTPSSIKEIFDAKQLYIFDTRITPDYIRYIRPLNENSDMNNDFNFNGKEKNIFEIFQKRYDQFDFFKFCNIALNEKRLYDKKFVYDNKPLISIVMPSFNKKDVLLKSIRSIQNQNFLNIEIIIVNDCSTDNSNELFKYLLETDERIRIFHHMTNLGVFRSRIDGILYSRGKYIILFDTGDLYEDKYVLSDAFNIMEKYNLDSCKFLFRMVFDFNNLTDNLVPYNLRNKIKIVYDSYRIKRFNDKIFFKCGNVWNRLTRADTYIKAILLLNELMLNVYKNFWDDIWLNELINKVSYSYAIIKRVGYVYYYDKKGEGTPQYVTANQKSKMIREYIAFLYYDYNFCVDRSCKNKIIDKLRYYNEIDTKNQLKNFIDHFEILNNLLEALIKDSDISKEDRLYCKKLLYESIIREKLGTVFNVIERSLN